MLISDYYKDQNRRLHASEVKFGHRGHRHLPEINRLMEKYGCRDALDYGCGEATLSKKAASPVTNYDPAIEKYEADPPQCDLIVCTDVLEHVEKECIDNVLSHIRSKMLIAGYFVINTREDISKTLPDGTNPHKLIKGSGWWVKKLSTVFHIENYWENDNYLYLIVR